MHAKRSPEKHEVPMKKILGEAKTIRQLLGGAKYSIDYYQREYKWESKQVAELIDDLTTRFLEDFEEGDERSAVEGYGHYFLGSIIISERDDKKFIVDGQQRLTTLTLVLIYLNNLQRGRPDTARSPIEELIFAARFGRRAFNIDVEEERERAACMEALFEDKEFDVEGKTETVANLIARYEELDERFPDELKEEALPYFIDWLIENVHLVEITAFSDDDAYTIFETMNDRGLSLSPIDMLKGFLLSKITDTHRRTSCNDLWKKRVQELAGAGKDVDADCFKAWLRGQYARTIRERKRNSEPGDFDRIGSDFHRWVDEAKDELTLDGSDSYARFINRDFEFYSRQYLQLIRASRTYTPGLEEVFYNAQAGFTLQPMLLLAPVLVSDDETTVRRKWRLAAIYLDILLTRRVWNSRSTDQSTMKYPVFQIMLGVRGLAPDALALRLKEELGSDEEVFSSNERFALHGMNRKQIARILARMTEFIEVGSGLASRYLEYTTATGQKRYEVEHVWADKHERHEDEFSHKADFAAYRNRIGGLLLLPKSFNASFGDLPYEEKVKHYNGQNLLARSLHPDCYDHNPGFQRFLQQTGLPFKPHAQFRRQDLDERHTLYRMLAERIWDPSRLVHPSP
jgi:uncharacterized protein with ParB-like and HNH nuclease domain